MLKDVTGIVLKERDYGESSKILDVFTKENRNGQSIVTVTHDINTALRGNRILYLKDGVICGDLQLGAYSEQENLDRHEKLKIFLAEMGW